MCEVYNSKWYPCTDMDIVPGTASDVFWVINNIDDGEFPWVELAVKIPYTHKETDMMIQKCIKK